MGSPIYIAFALSLTVSGLGMRYDIKWSTIKALANFFTVVYKKITPKDY